MDTDSFESFICCIISLCFWIFIFKIIYRDYYKSYNLSQYSPAEPIYQIVVILLTISSFFYNDDEINSSFEGKLIIFNTLFKDLIELSHSNKSTPIMWWYHHCTETFASIPLLYFNSLYQVHRKNLFFWEFGAILYFLRKHKQIKKFIYLQFCCVTMYLISRIAIAFKVFDLYKVVIKNNNMSNYDSLEYYFHLIFIFANILMLQLNLWWTYTSYKRLFLKFKHLY